MDKELILTIVLAILGSNGFFAVVQLLITRHDTKKNVKGKLERLEKDGLRTQLLLLILMKPKEDNEILTIAEHYFKKPPAGLGGNWYMTSMFKKWLEDNNVGRPEWFETE